MRGSIDSMLSLDVTVVARDGVPWGEAIWQRGKHGEAGTLGQATNGWRRWEWAMVAKRRRTSGRKGM